MLFPNRSLCLPPNSIDILYFFSPKNEVGNPAAAVLRVMPGLSDVWGGKSPAQWQVIGFTYLTNHRRFVKEIKRKMQSNVFYVPSGLSKHICFERLTLFCYWNTLQIFSLQISMPIFIKVKRGGMNVVSSNLRTRQTFLQHRFCSAVGFYRKVTVT